MKEIVLEAQKRELSTKGTTNDLRRAGRVPGIAYGDQEKPLTVSVDTKSLLTVLQSEGGRNSLITLKVDGTSHPVLLREIQRHPISRAIRHVDFHRISLTKKIEAPVPVHVKGEAPGVKLGGGVLEHVVREVRVRCLPTEIPASLDVDVSNLQINQGLRAKDLVLPAGVELLLDKESIIVNIVAPTILEEVTPAAALPGEAASTEPEVIKKGKVDEEGAEAAAPGDKKAAAPAAKADAKKPEGK